MTIRAAAAALCVAVLVVGCGSDDPEPKPLPPVASASPSQAAALPMPSEAAAETPQGAAAFARYWFGLLNAAFDAGDASAVRASSHPDCDGCNNLIGAIEEELPPGERIEGGDFTVLSAESPPLEGENALVDVQYALSELRVVNPNGDVLRTTPAEPRVGGQLRLVRDGSSWVVRGFRNVAS